MIEEEVVETLTHYLRNMGLKDPSERIKLIALIEDVMGLKSEFEEIDWTDDAWALMGTKNLGFNSDVYSVIDVAGVIMGKSNPIRTPVVK